MIPREHPQTLERNILKQFFLLQFHFIHSSSTAQFPDVTDYKDVSRGIIILDHIQKVKVDYILSLEILLHLHPDIIVITTTTTTRATRNP